LKSARIKRNSEAFDEKVKSALKRLPWAQESLAVIDSFKVKKELVDAFLKIKQIERKAPGRERRALQFKSLLATAVEGGLYSAQDRMEFIKNIAVKYHGLMIRKEEYMERTITEISAWRNRT